MTQVYKLGILNINIKHHISYLFFVIFYKFGYISLTFSISFFFILGLGLDELIINKIFIFFLIFLIN